MMHKGRTRFVRLTMVAGLIAGVTVTAAAPAGAAPRWSVVASPSPAGPPSGELSAVSCSSATSCLAVGNSNSGGLQAEKWNGTTWTIVAAPSGSGAADITLNGLSCTSATNCVAVGDSDTLTGDDFETKSLVERWNGTSWSVVTSPSPAGAAGAALTDVSCASASNCFAVGYSLSSHFRLTALLERWNGTKWSSIAVPTPAGTTDSELSGLSCSSAASCFAVGGASGAEEDASSVLVLRWNGTAWSVVTTPDTGSGSGFFDGPGLTSVSCASATSCLAVGGGESGTVAEQWNGTSWSIVDTPIPHGSTDAELVSVSCASATDCSAVGDYFTASSDPEAFDFNTLAEHWNGTSWAVVPTPSGAPVHGLSDVSCPTTTSCAAVGDSALAEHWDGAAWSVAPFGTPTSQSQLIHVTCVTPTDCVAVGGRTTSSGSKTLVEHWNGSKWVIVASPNPSGSLNAGLYGVACRSTTNCNAVGTYQTQSAQKTLVEHWNGTSWAIVASPNPAGSQLAVLISVSCPTVSSCNAVGATFGSSGVKALAEHWNGTSWTIVPSASPSGAFIAELLAVSCPSPIDCHAVGIAFGSSGIEPLAEHWNGTSWTVVPTPSPSGATDVELAGLSCHGARDCTAVGRSSQSESATKTLTEHWNGSTWSIIPSPTPSGAGTASLNAVVCRSAISCYAVGGSSTKTADKTLVEHWDGYSWSIAPSATPSNATGSTLNGVWCPSPTTCIAVGNYNARAGSFTLAEIGT